MTASGPQQTCFRPESYYGAFSRLPANNITSMEKLTFSQRVIRMAATSSDIEQACSLLPAVSKVVRDEAASS